MSDSFNFKEFSENVKKNRGISKRIDSLEKEQDDLKYKKALENFFVIRISHLLIIFSLINVMIWILTICLYDYIDEK